MNRRAQTDIASADKAYSDLESAEHNPAVTIFRMCRRGEPTGMVGAVRGYVGPDKTIAVVYEARRFGVTP